jgi:adenylate cyclase
MVRNLRMASGLVLMLYVTSHLVNHSLGLVSLGLLEAGRLWFLAVWRTPLGTLLLYGSLAGHLGLSLWGIYSRRKLAMTPGEGLQHFLGMAIPILLIGHVVGTRGAVSLAGINDNYAYVLLVYWKFDTSLLYWQLPGLLAAWIHGCLGLHFWLRLKPYYRSVVPFLYGVALILPLLAVLGFWQAGRDVLALAENPEWLANMAAINNWPNPETVARLKTINLFGQGAMLGLVALTMLARGVRAMVERRRGTVRVTYPEGRIIASAPGASILEISLIGGIPHASICGGRGRCSTCRVRVREGAEALPAPSSAERRVLERVGAPVNVRLACQTRPTRDVSVTPLLPPNATTRDAHPRPAMLAGQEREIAVLFSDIRSFTKFAEDRLPYDVVFVLNSYFASMGEAVVSSGGHLDKFIGDGMMALFGLHAGPEEACRQAIAAARKMSLGLAELNTSLAGDLNEPIRMGIGLHVGSVIVGEIGYGAATSVTAIGDTVNTASRLEAMSKEFGCELVVSQELVTRAGLSLDEFPSQEVELRGRSAQVPVRVIARASDLPETTS